MSTVEKYEKIIRNFSSGKFGPHVRHFLEEYGKIVKAYNNVNRDPVPDDLRIFIVLLNT